MGFVGDKSVSTIFVWGILDDSLLFLSKLEMEGDFKTVLAFVGDAILVLGTEALSTILFWVADVISVLDLLSLLSVLSTDRDFVGVFGLDGRTTVLMGPKVPSSFLIRAGPGEEPIEYLNSFLSTLSREGDFVRIFGLVGESVFLFDTDRSLFILFCATERAMLPFLGLVVDLECCSLFGFAPEVVVSVSVLSKSKRFGLAGDSVASLAILKVGSGPAEPWVSLEFAKSTLFTEAFSFVEPAEK